MRSLNIRHPAMRCVAEALLDLFPSGADISEIGTDAKPCLFVSWRTGGMATHPGNIAWGVHYRFETEALSLFDFASEPAQHYADPDAVSLKIVDVPAELVRQSMAAAG
jgi:hypothetical protein